MAVKNENYSFLKSWSDIYVDEYMRTSSAMSDYHAHDYYEISLILSGEVKVLTPGVSSESDAPRAVLSAPGVPHYITCTEGTAYRRINVIFSEEFISASDDSSEVMGIFNREGCVISLDSESAELLAEAAPLVLSFSSFRILRGCREKRCSRVRFGGAVLSKRELLREDRSGETCKRRRSRKDNTYDRL